MEKIKIFTFAIVVSILLSCFNLVAHAESIYDELGTKVNVPANKIWTIKFSGQVNIDSITDSSVFIKGQDGQTVPISKTITEDRKTIMLEALTDYEVSKTYTLYINSVKSDSGKTLMKNRKMSFTIADTSSTTSKYMYGVVQKIDEQAGAVNIDILSQGIVKYDYSDDWIGYQNCSVILMDGKGKPISDISAYKQEDNLFDYKNSKIKFSNIKGYYALDKNVLIVLSSKAGNYLKQGTTKDIELAVKDEKFTKILMDPDTKVVKVIVIEQ